MNQSHRSLFSTALGVVVSEARGFLWHDICQGLQSHSEGALSSLACRSLFSSVGVDVSYAAMRLSFEKYCLLSWWPLCAMYSFWAFLPRNAAVPRISWAVTCRADTMMVLTFSAYWVGMTVLCWRLCFSARITECAVVAWSSKASENFSHVAGSLSLDEWDWVREKLWGCGDVTVGLGGSLRFR